MEAESKSELRRELRAQLADIDRQYRASASAELCMRLLSLPEYRESAALFCFAGLHSEPNTLPFIRWALAHGKRVCLPRVLGGGAMEARYISEVSELLPGAMGIMEPPESAVLAEPQDIGFAVLPCLAATREGARLGHGGGYYDRYLAGLPCHTAIACFELQLREELPREPHDIAAELVVTERAVYRP